MKKLIVGLAATAIALIAVAAPTSAHVSVNPQTAEQGSYAKLTFRVPTESDSASTTKLEVTFPTDKPLAYVGVQPKQGWTYSVDKTNLATPIKSDDGDITEAVSKVTWTADSGSGIKPGEFDEFSISAGPLPTDTTSLEFKTVQTYSNGDVVRWIDTASGSTEPEHPAPTLTLTPASSDSGHGTTATTAATATSDHKDSDNDQTVGVVALIVAIVAIILSIGAIASKRRSS